LETRKYQLQKQIIEALKANDNDLYSLLKSQWAHRFGVDSLEELKSLDLEQLNQTPNNVDNQKIDQSQENSFEGEKETSIKDDDNQSKEIINKEVDESVKDENDKSFTITSYSIADKENDEDKTINPYKDSRSQPEIKALIPLPPRPKYSYLKKWLLR
jgi:TATA-binding protein-associated factor Taf7